LKVALTGGTGFIGANLARRLLNEDNEVHLLVRPGFTRWRIESIRDQVEVHEVDLAGTASEVVAVVRRVKPDHAFHLAAYGAYSWQTDLLKMIQTNIAGTANFFKACAETGVECFVNTGSSSEYGFKDHAPREDEPPEPNSTYAVTKASATLLCKQLAGTVDMRVQTLRLYSAYGPFEEPDRMMPTLIVQGLRGRLPKLVDPTVGRDFVYVDDVVDAYLRVSATAASEPGAIYNVGTGTQTDIRQLVELARSELSISEDPVWGSMTKRRWDTETWISDPYKIRREVGWQPAYSLKEGFRKFADWMRENLDLYTKGRE
jgi:nucleoside-diphosphate-sugar epimerase